MTRVTGLSHLLVVANVAPKDLTSPELGHKALDKVTVDNAPAGMVPVLWVGVNTLKLDHSPVDEYSVSMFVSLAELVTLSREPKTELRAETWRSTVSMAVTDAATSVPPSAPRFTTG